MIEFFVPGKPVPKARARVVRHNGITRSYTPESTANFELLVKYAAYEAMSNQELATGPLRMNMTMCLSPPASWSKKKSALAIEGRVLPTVKPDISNVQKSVEDAMNGVVYVDDSQLCQIVTAKCYSLQPGVRIRIERLDAEPSK